MSDQRFKMPLGENPHGIRPETWAVAQYDALREALNGQLARISAEEDRLEHLVYKRIGADVRSLIVPSLEQFAAIEARALRARRSIIDASATTEEIHQIARVDVHHVSVKTRLRAAIEIELHNTVVIDQEHIVVDIIRER